MAKFCSNCGKTLNEEDTFCEACGTKLSGAQTADQAPNQTQYQAPYQVPPFPPQGAAYQQQNTAKNSDFMNKIKESKTYYIKLAVFVVVALIVLIMAFVGAGSISRGANNMTYLQSQAGNTVAEAYYQYSGTVYSGFATAIRTIGIFFAAVLVGLGLKKG